MAEEGAEARAVVLLPLAPVAEAEGIPRFCGAVHFSYKAVAVAVAVAEDKARVKMAAPEAPGVARAVLMEQLAAAALVLETSVMAGQLLREAPEVLEVPPVLMARPVPQIPEVAEVTASMAPPPEQKLTEEPMEVEQEDVGNALTSALAVVVAAEAGDLVEVEAKQPTEKAPVEVEAALILSPALVRQKLPGLAQRQEVIRTKIILEQPVLEARAARMQMALRATLAV